MDNNSIIEWAEELQRRFPYRPRKGATKPETKSSPTLVQMGKSFTKAMTKWAASGFEVVDEAEYIRRRQICNACHGGWRCPKCGCMLWAKAALATEKCEKWE